MSIDKTVNIEFTATNKSKKAIREMLRGLDDISMYIKKFQVSNLDHLTRSLKTAGTSFNQISKSVSSASTINGFNKFAKIDSTSTIMLAQATKKLNDGIMKTNDLIRTSTVQFGASFPKGTKQYSSAIANLRNQWDMSGMSGIKMLNATRAVDMEIKDGSLFVNKYGKFQDGLTGKVQKFSDVARKSARQSMRPFRGEFLSLMFIGMGLQQTFGGMINSVLQLTGIFDAFRGILASILLPILMPLIAQWLPKLIEKLKDPAFKDFIGRFIIFAAVIGTVLAVLFPLLLLFSTLGINLGTIATVLGIAFTSWSVFGLVLGMVASIVAIVIGVFRIFTGIIKNELWPVLQGLLIVLGALAAIFAGPIVAVIGGAIALIALFADKLNLLRGIVLLVAQPLVMLLDLLRGIGEAFKGNFNFDFRLTKQTFGGMIDAFKNPFGKPTEGIGSLFSTPLSAPAVERKEPLGSMLGGEQVINYQPDINVTMAQNGMNGDELARYMNNSFYTDLKTRGI